MKKKGPGAKMAFHHPYKNSFTKKSLLKNSKKLINNIYEKTFLEKLLE